MRLTGLHKEGVGPSLLTAGMVQLQNLHGTVGEPLLGTVGEPRQPICDIPFDQLSDYLHSSEGLLIVLLIYC